MTIASMTGFARVDGGEGNHTWIWEARSVNGRGLDIRCRLPQGHDEIEVQARKMAGEKFSRGNISIGLTLRQTSGDAQYVINRELLDRLVETANSLAAESNGEPPALDRLLGVRGVVEAAELEENDAARQALKTAMLDGLRQLLNELHTTRGEEGSRILPALEGQLGTIEALCEAAEKVGEAQPAALKAKLEKQVDELLDGGPREIPPERLAQEVAILLTKADVREEIDRLKAHLEAARELLDGGGAIGRRLDFLCQEFTREANTICSKAADIELTNIGLEMKAAVEQFREQVQNLE